MSSAGEEGVAPAERSGGRPRAGAPSEPLVLGIGGSHNGSVCLLRGEEPLVCVQRERLTGVKRDWIWAAEETVAVRYCLDAAGVGAGDLDAVALTGLPSVHDPRHDVRANPVLGAVARRVPVVEVGHHRAHAASAHALSGRARAAILVCDGAGTTVGDLDPDERAAATAGTGSEAVSMYLAEDDRVTPLVKQIADGPEGWLGRREGGMRRFGSLGGMYAAVADQIFGDPHESGKVMGLAPCGTPAIPVEEFLVVRDRGIRFPGTVAERFRHDERWPARGGEYTDLAASAQAALETGLRALLSELRRRAPGERSLGYAGGVALNVVANRRAIEESGHEDVFTPPAADDGGAAVGAAYLALWALRGRRVRRRIRRDLSGRRYGDADVRRAIAAFPGVRARRSEDPAEEACGRLERGEVVGWFQDGSELGPRALGRRSILCDPRGSEARPRLNARVKYREPFRPFAPLLPRRELARWFEARDGESRPFMLSALPFRAERAGAVPAAVHVDGTGRVQTVDPEVEPLLHGLLDRWGARTGVPLLLNTSFNLAGEPIVETPEDAVRCLLASRIDCVVAGPWVVERPRETTLLDMVPVPAGTEVPKRPGVHRVRTPWGPAEVRLDGVEAAVAGRADGRTGARRILEEVDPGADERSGLSLLHRLARIRVVALRPPAAQAPAARRTAA